jgi:regulator of protease activity HflC (stomatin/prohibitin superfamily)
MKRITIKKNHVALVFRNGDYSKVLNAGSHWVSLWDEVIVYNMSTAFNAPEELSILLKDEHLAALLTIVLVGENEISLLFEDQLFREVLTPGRYAFWNGTRQLTYITADLSDINIPSAISGHILEKPAVAAYVRNYRIEPQEKGVLMVDGKLQDILEPGNYSWWKNSTVIQVSKADMRQMNMEITGQEILTRDKAQLRINFMLQYRVTDIVKALLDNKEFEKQLYVLVQLGLREFIGRMGFDELMDSREKIAGHILSEYAAKAETLGVTLLNCGVKDIILPGDVRDIMNQVLVAEKKAQANIIMRREETASTRSLLNTAKLMEDNTMLFKLKEMEYVERIAEKIHTLSISGGGQIMDQLKQVFVK